jgi:transcriptional regulator with XRE-family HTH domain
MGEHKASAEFEAWLVGLRSRLRTARESRGLTVRAAADLAGVPFASISRAEMGRNVPTLGFLHDVAAGYGVPLCELLCVPPAPPRRGKQK